MKCKTEGCETTMSEGAPEHCPRCQEIIGNKELHRDIDAQIQKVKALPGSRERSITITKLQEAVMWLGMDLKRLDTPNPYPDSKDPSNTRIQPTADGLKL